VTEIKRRPGFLFVTKSAENTKEAVRQAYDSGADFAGADLVGAHYALEDRVGPEMAGALIYIQSDRWLVPKFRDSALNALADIRRCAGLVNASKQGPSMSDSDT